MRLLDADAGQRAPDGDPVLGPGNPADAAARERLRQPHVWINAAGDRFWVKCHWKAVRGIELTQGEADAMVSGGDANFRRRDLWNAIAAGDAPEWRLEMQIMPFEDAAEYRLNAFDVTNSVPYADYPPITVERFMLRSPANLFAEVEQAAFTVGTMVPGIGLSSTRADRGDQAPAPTPRRCAARSATTTRSARNSWPLPRGLPMTAEQISGCAGDDSTISSQPLWWPPNKLSGRCPVP